MVFSTTLNNSSVISLRSALLVNETVVPGENHRPVTSQLQTLSHNVVSSTTEGQLDRARFELTTSVMIDTNCKSNDHGNNCKNLDNKNTYNSTMRNVYAKC